MRTFLSNSVPSLILIATVAAGGYLVLAPPVAPADKPAPIELATHTSFCPVCRLAPYGHDGHASRFGPAQGAASETKTTSF
jgi:hypothetical protein